MKAEAVEDLFRAVHPLEYIQRRARELGVQKRQRFFDPACDEGELLRLMEELVVRAREFERRQLRPEPMPGMVPIWTALAAGA